MNQTQVEVDSLQRLVGELTTALGTDRVIGAAIGVLMERFGLEYQSAQRHVVSLSQNSNSKMYLVAEGLLPPTDPAR